MTAPSVSARLLDVLLHQEGEHDPEIRGLSLATLNDTDALSTAVLLWTHLGWVWALAITGWLWLLPLMALDLILFGIRWRLRRGFTPRGRPLDAGSATLSAWVNLLLIVLVTVDVVILTQAPSDRSSVVAIIISLGCCGYVVALFTAFPILAIVNIALLNAGLSMGLTFGDSDLARPFALLAPGGIIVYWLLTQRTHATLLGAIRAQLANRRVSLHDPLTKLPNRAFMRERLAHLLSVVGRPAGPSQVAVLCIDLDGFKGINDRHGHAAGDWVLIHVADILGRLLPPDGLACRIGGDEYVVLLPGWGEERVLSFADTLIATIREPFDIGRAIPARIGASVGAAITRDPNKDLDDLVEEADVALYGAKRAGKGRVQIGTAAADAPVPIFESVPARNR